MIRIDERSATPIYEQIVQSFKALIAKGALAEGDRIPSVRELSATLLVNHNTVAKSYQELERQGVIVSLRGKGAFVAKAAEEPGMERERLLRLRAELRRIAVEAHHLGVGSDRLQAWLMEDMREYGGDRDAGGEPSTQED
ncbi:GntR family transcriptional regulator [Cohnella hashimotonis]|uniref:GntR family transcriptional regulator n=1 Tax=Cohnella hashimotonis TaxID=2826895 RepID=A0ABT6TRL7_9BACL|nr:GntR family transcriptional regulator [Cohnella hashimotonis]MDI4649491.1 GntR family transcriptional regulator [Cohnella hashimotonis]